MTPDQTAAACGAALAVSALCIAWAERCRPVMQPVAWAIGTAALSYATVCACRIITTWVILRAEGIA